MEVIDDAHVRDRAAAADAADNNNIDDDDALESVAHSNGTNPQQY